MNHNQTIVDGHIVEPHIIQDEGTSLIPRPYLNFVGANVTVTDVGGKTVITISGLSEAAGDARYLKLDQTTPQTVDNGAPTFNEGLVATATGDTAITANKDIVLKAGRKLIFDGA